MRAIILLLIIVVVGAIIAVETGLIHLTQTQTAQVPGLSIGNGAVTAHGGRAPSFEVETGSVAVGTKEREVTLPKVALPLPSIQVNRPGTDAQKAAQANAAAANGSAPAK